MRGNHDMCDIMDGILLKILSSHNYLIRRDMWNEGMPGKMSFEGPEGSGEVASYISWLASEKASNYYSKALVRVQAHIKPRNVGNSQEGKSANERCNEADPVKQAEQGWCDIPRTVEEVKAKLQMRQEGAIKRDRTKAYSQSKMEPTEEPSSARRRQTIYRMRKKVLPHIHMDEPSSSPSHNNQNTESSVSLIMTALDRPHHGLNHPLLGAQQPNTLDGERDKGSFCCNEWLSTHACISICASWVEYINELGMSKRDE
ncbi:hypothetical protein JHK86_055396 [Glycine max]|nr:hypothetical protein JHK86_055396 [Glycine max]